MISLKKLRWMRVGTILLALILAGGVVLFYTQAHRCGQPAGKGEPASLADAAGDTDPVSSTTVAQAVSPVETKTRAAYPALNQPPKRGVTLAVAALDQALDAQSELPLVPRLAALRALGFGVSRSDWEAVRDFVGSSEKIEALNPDQLRYLKNEAMSVLIRADVWLDEAAEAFKVVYADHEQDIGVRDYALQFIAVTAEKDARVGWGFHWQALRDENKDLASTASLHLLRAANRGELTKQEQTRLGSAALGIASNASIPATNRATALQVCAELGIREAGKIAYAVSRNEHEALIARLSAIAALGQLGGSPETQAYLRSLTTGPDRSLHVAATAALARFKLNGG